MPAWEASQGKAECDAWIVSVNLRDKTGRSIFGDWNIVKDLGNLDLVEEAGGVGGWSAPVSVSTGGRCRRCWWYQQRAAQVVGGGSNLGNWYLGKHSIEVVTD